MNTLYILSALCVLVLLAEILRFKKLLFALVIAGLLIAIAAAVNDWNTHLSHYSNMMKFDNYSVSFAVLVCTVFLLWVLAFRNFFESEQRQTDHYALALFALCGALAMVSYSNMVMLFLGIEILSVPLYVLAGSRKDDLSSNEAALKYFLMGAFATGFLLFGIALIYGGAGTFDIDTLGTYLASSVPGSPWMASGRETLLHAGILMMMAGLCFKVSAAPFHFWAPDVYQGAPTPVTAFMATLVKIAAFAAFLRLFITCFSQMTEVWANVIWALSALTILLGNIIAVYQANVKRMLAYSSVSHAGYLLLALIAMNEHSAGSVLYYAAAYSVATIGAFAVLYIMEQETPSQPSPKGKEFSSQLSPFGGEGGGVDSFSGLSKRNPLLAFAMAVSMLSLSGIPPLAGFFGKYYIFSSLMQSGYLWLVLIAVLGSLIGVYYYFRVIISMYSTGEAEFSERIQIPLLTQILLVSIIILSFLLGLFPDMIIKLI